MSFYKKNIRNHSIGYSYSNQISVLELVTQDSLDL
jgi:hypothetical protein